MGQSDNNRVQALLNDTNDAFLSCRGSMNTDYAEFAGMAISDFRTALRNPNLRRKDLVGMLRKIMAKTACEDQKQWPILMAKQLKKSANDRIG